MSELHLDRYSTRKLKDGERTEMAIRKTAGERLLYEGPIGERGRWARRAMCPIDGMHVACYDRD